MLNRTLRVLIGALLFALPHFTMSQERVGYISHDSIMALNESAFLFIFSDIKQADSLANFAYNLARYQKDSVAIARSSSVIGSVYWGQAQYNLSLKWHFNALRKYEELNDTIGIIKGYNNIAEDYKKLKYHKNALRFLNRARGLIKEYSKVESSVLNNLNIAQVYVNLNQNDSALYYLDATKKMPNKNISIKMLSFMNYLYAKLKYNLGSYEEGIVYIDQSIYFANLIHNQLRLANAYLLLGELDFLANNLTKAKVELKKALGIAQKYGYEDIELEVFNTLYQIAVMQENSSEAFIYLFNYSELKDKIYNVSVSRQAAEFESVYQLEKMEKENSLLQQKQDSSSNVIKYQIGFIIVAMFALVIVIYFLLTVNKQRKALKIVVSELEAKSNLVELQKQKLEKQSQTTEVLNKELTLLNKNLETRAQEIAREIEVKNKKMNKYAFMNAHKLRAPIASILGLINLFGKDIGANDEALMVSMLKESADKLDKVVHEIKDVIDE